MGVYVYQNEQLDKVAGLGYSVVDSAISSSSENPVQNKVVKEYVDTKVAKDQGVGQSGKVLGINTSGMVEPVDVAGSASDITYDNSTSGLSATDVQGAVDEVDTAVDGLESQVSTLISSFQVSVREQGCINGSRAKGIEWDVDELMALVRNGDFEKFAIGDYITDANTSIEFAIADKNHYPAWAFAGGTTNINHIVLMPFTKLATSYAFNSSNTNSGGYRGSNMPSNMETEYAKLSATIRGYCKATRIFENNKGTWTYADRYMRLPTVVETTGTAGWAGSDAYYNGATSQLALCKSALFRVYSSSWYWMLDPSSYNTTSFCLLDSNGVSNSTIASNTGAVRPLIVLA